MTKDKMMYKEIYKTFGLDSYFKEIKNKFTGTTGHFDSTRSAVYKTIDRAYKKHFSAKPSWKDLSPVDKNSFLYEVLWNNKTFRNHIESAHENDLEIFIQEINKKRESLSVELANKTIDYFYEIFEICDEDTKTKINSKYEKFVSYLSKYNQQYPHPVLVPCISKSSWILLLRNGVTSVSNYVASYENEWVNISEKFSNLINTIHIAITSELTQTDIHNIITLKIDPFFDDKLKEVETIIAELSSQHIDNNIITQSIEYRLSDLFPLESEIFRLITNQNYSVTEEEIDHIAIRVLIKALSEQLHISINRHDIKEALQAFKQYNATHDAEIKMDASNAITQKYMQYKHQLENLSFYDIVRYDDDSSLQNTLLYSEWISLIDSIIGDDFSEKTD